MAFNTHRAFSLAAQGVSTDGQPDDRLPGLKSGIHLRWAFAQYRGFPRFGYYLLRRQHVPERRPPRLLSEMLRNRTTLSEGVFGSGNEYHLETNPRANFDHEVPVVDQYTLTGQDDIHLSGDGRHELRIGGQRRVRLGFDEPTYRVEVALAVKYSQEVELHAQAGDVTLDSTTMTDNGVTTLSGDGITTIQFDLVGREKHPEDSVTIVEVRFYRIVDGLAEDWAFVPGTPRPFTLPVVQSSYQGQVADIDAARTLAEDRIEYGSPERYTALASPESVSGTASVEADGVLIDGTNTDWTPELAGRTIRLDDDETAYTILEVPTTDRLVLSRPYEGSDRVDVDYTVRSDRFETIHDMLATVVSAPGEGGMADRPYPGIVYDDGSVGLDNQSPTVDGSGTNWNGEFEGLALHVARETTGAADVTTGSPVVTGASTSWSSDLEGELFRLGDERSLYVITSAAEGEITLNRPYSGDSVTSSYEIYERSSRLIAEVVDGTTLTLTESHRGDDVADRSYLVTATLRDTGPVSASAAGKPATTIQYPMDGLLVGSLDPAIAQLLGLYWTDDTVGNDSYDYLVVADYLDAVRSGATVWGIDLDSDDPLPRAFVQTVLNTAGAFENRDSGGSGTSGDPTRGPIRGVPLPVTATLDTVLDGAIVFDERRSDDAPHTPPQQVRAYSLPGVTIETEGTTNTPTESVRDAQTVAGLRWDRSRAESGTLLPEQATMFYLWRYDHPTGASLTRPQASQYDPVFVEGPHGTAEEFVEHVEPTFLTGRRPDAPAPPPDWPSFELATTDSTAGGGWHSYSVSGVDIFGRHSGLSSPASWYDYDPEGRHDQTTPETEFAIELVDETPPPPPINVTARTIDGDDPYLLTGDGTWLDDRPDGTIGLYLRWEWPAEYRRQAPDLDRFELRYLTGPLDADEVTVRDVSPLGGDRFRVRTDVQPGGDLNEFVGTVLRTDGRRCRVVAATVNVTSGHLELTVDATTDEGGDPIPPVAGPGRLTVPPVITEGTATLKKDIRTVDGTDTNWTVALEGETFYPATAPVGYEIDEVVSATELRLVDTYQPPAAVTDGAPVTYRITHPRATDRSDPDAWQGAPGTWVATHGTVLADEHVSFGVGDEPDVYELRVEAPGTGLGDDSFEPSQFEPVTTAHVGIYAVDEDGNRGAVGAPASVTNVHRDRPSSPEMPVLQGEVDEATPADYDGKSHYTFRWKRPAEPLASNVFRAMDESVFQVDFDRHGANETLDPGAESMFPQELHGEGRRGTRESIRDELEDVWSRADRGEAMDAYRSLTPNAFRVLAGLPGNEGAFSQLTSVPIERDEHPNAPGPDDPEYGESNPQGYSSDLHAYTDELDGRSSNWYIYRAGTVDPGNNRSDRPEPSGTGGTDRDLGFPCLPVAFPDTLSPRTPSLTAVEGGDREIRIRWTRNSEPDLAEYRIYRTDDPDAARDVRLMDEVATVQPADPDPGARPPEREWVDDPLPGMHRYTYRLVAVDDAGNASEPSQPASSAAYDYGPPAEPTWERGEWIKLDDQGAEHPWSTTDSSLSAAVALAFTTSERDVTAVVQRRTDGTWRTVSGWLAEPDGSGTDWRFEAVDETASPDGDATYRAKLVSAAGVELVSTTEQTVQVP